MSINKRINDGAKLQNQSYDTSEPYTFIVGADPQFGLISRYIEKKADVVWDKEIALFTKCIKKINEINPKPKFFAIVGDLCDAFSTDDENYELRKQQECDFFSISNGLNDDIPLVAVSGNHDVGDVPIPLSIERYRASYGPDYYRFVINGTHFIVINSQYYVDSSLCATLAEEQEIWLEKALEEAKNSKSPSGPVIFMHTPPFVSDFNEPDTYFSLVKAQREKLLDRFLKAGVKYVFCGHLHKNAGGKYKDLEVITTTAIGGQLGGDVSGFRVVTVNKDKLEWSFHGIED